MAAALQIEKRSLEVQAADAIRKRIVSGELPAGERLTEIRLSDELNLSRGTVRSALLRLATEGLIEQVPYSGWNVVRLTARDAWELYTLRSSMESLAARLAAANLTKSGEKPLEEALEALARACADGNLALVAHADFGLHKKIIEASGHVRLGQQYLAIENQVQMYIASSDALVVSREAVLEQHRPLLAAILSRNVEAAATIARDHNLVEGQTLVRHFREVEGLSDDSLPPLSFGTGSL
jgi:DNA-binding GntR family transcriptional regulator